MACARFIANMAEYALGAMPEGAGSIQEAWGDEMDQFRRREVAGEAQEGECRSVASKVHKGTRWIDINEGDEASPECRPQIAAQQAASNV
eukprot:3573592-Pyramimonas_sp.AAC.1